MHSSTIRYLLALALLALVLIFLVTTGLYGPVLGAANPAELTYVADLDFWQRSTREQLMTTPYHFDLAHDLNEIPLEVGEWRGRDVPQTNIGVFIVLEPEQYVERLYSNSSGQYIWLTMIGGRGSRTFHPPESCYDSYGWQTELSSYGIPLDEGGQAHGMLIHARQNSEEQISYYFYLFPKRSRLPNDGIVIFRVTSPRYGTTEETMAVQRDFVRHFFSQSVPTRS
jgi:hypothetical protein